MDLISKALAFYGSGYRGEFAAKCNTKIPEKANWCGVFAGALLTDLGLELPDRPQVARSYLKVGQPVSQPELGDLVVFWRVYPKDWRGHVSLFIREDEFGIYCLGGNQQGRVQIVKYSKFKLLGYRRVHEPIILHQPN